MWEIFVNYITAVYLLVLGILVGVLAIAAPIFVVIVIYNLVLYIISRYKNRKDKSK